MTIISLLQPSTPQHGGSAALRSTDGFAPRTAATTAQQGITDGQTPIVAG
jgi:hypothetical protein